MRGVSDLVAEKDSAGEGARGEGTILPPDVQVPYVPPFRYRSAAAWYRCRMPNEKDSSPTRTELMWREYQAGVDLYKFYVEVVIKVLIGYYAITGGILSFYFAKADTLRSMGTRSALRYQHRVGGSVSMGRQIMDSCSG